MYLMDMSWGEGKKELYHIYLLRGCLDNRMSDILSVEINQSTAKNQMLISLKIRNYSANPWLIIKTDTQMYGISHKQ